MRLSIAFLFCLLLTTAGIMRGAGSGTISGPLVSNEQWPRSTDLVTWTTDVMRIEGLEHASETAQGKKFFEWLRLFCRMAVGGMIQAYEGDYGKEKYVTDAHKNLFVYGWGYCDTCSRIADAAWKEYKRDRLAAQRVVVQHPEGGYHTMYRLRLDGHYGAFDPRYGYYLIDRDAPDARVLDWAEVGVDANITKNLGYKNRSKPFFEIAGIEWKRALDLQPVFFESETAWRNAGAPKESVFGDSAYQIGTRFHDMSFRVPRGTTIERFWDNSARQFYVPAGKHTEREWPFLASGRFYRVTETSLEGRWPRFDPNYQRMKTLLSTVPTNEDYPAEMAGGKTIGQASGRILYQPDLRRLSAAEVLEPGSDLVHSASAPYLRPASMEAAGSGVIEIYSPYVLVNGVLEGELAGAGTRIEIRAERPRYQGGEEPASWSPWQELAAGLGSFRTELGRPRFNGKDISIYGVYRFQLRVSVPAAPGRKAPAGLSALKLSLTFENGIMSIPRLFAGRNNLRFKVSDAAQLRGPLTVTYRYDTDSGEQTAVHILKPGDFHGNAARYTVEAPGLTRCRSVAVTY